MLLIAVQGFGLREDEFSPGPFSWLVPSPVKEGFVCIVN